MVDLPEVDDQAAPQPNPPNPVPEQEPGAGDDGSDADDHSSDGGEASFQPPGPSIIADESGEKDAADLDTTLPANVIQHRDASLIGLLFSGFQCQFLFLPLDIIRATINIKVIAFHHHLTTSSDDELEKTIDELKNDVDLISRSWNLYIVRGLILAPFNFCFTRSSRT